MIIPIKCFTCNKTIAHLWEQYQNSLQEKLGELKENYQEDINDNKIKSIEQEILDSMGLERYCCRRMMISHVDLCDKI